MFRKLTALLLLASPAIADERPNVVLFIADDVSWNDYGCYGSKTARTPNIDALAAQGRRFDQAFLTASSCSPSRCSIVTGRYPHNNGGASELHRPLSWHLVKFPALLREAGYYTALSGKNHMPQDKPPAGEVAPPKAWDHVDGGRGPGNSGGHANWVSVANKRPLDKPFFFWFAAYDAHRDWDGDKQWQDEFGPKHGGTNVSIPPFLVNDNATRDDLASYHNEVTRFDHFIGLTVAALKEQGVLENTLILVMADNGRPFPRAKTRLHDSGMKTALVAHWPKGLKQPGAATDSLVSSIDIAPTVLEIAGVEAPDTLQGISMTPLLADPTAITRRHAFSEHNWHDYEAHGRSVRSDGYLYLVNNRPYQAWQGPADSVRSPSHVALLEKKRTGTLSVPQQDVFLSPRPRFELYNSKIDPNQLTNLAGQPEHKAVQESLAKLLQTWQTATGDTVPQQLTPDTFDRETGDRSIKGTPRGTAPGTSQKADQIRLPGPGQP